ncbi:MAG: ABC transporter permease subunit [Planctomycetes bacterium]|nr:ABC transporter permease subunit [Planctomycetota bacterium]
MKGCWAIASRELGSYFRQPAGWIIIALYLFLTGLVFATGVLIPGRVASLRDFFALSGWLLLPVAPAISMRLVSEELRSGTIENLFSSPVSPAAIVIGKYLGASIFMLTMLVPTLVYPIVLRMYASPTPDPGPIAAGYLCLILLGTLYLSIGLLASTLTPNATLAFMVTLFAILGLMFAGTAADWVTPPLRAVLRALAIGPRVMDFSRGVIDTVHVVGFLSVSAFFVFLSVICMEARRWR